MTNPEVQAALDALSTNLNEVVRELGNHFTFENFRQKLTQKNQRAYIDLLVACRDYQYPFGQAHWFIGDRFRPTLTGPDYRYTRTDRGRSHDEKNIFGDDTDLIVYER